MVRGDGFSAVVNHRRLPGGQIKQLEKPLFVRGDKAVIVGIDGAEIPQNYLLSNKKELARDKRTGVRRWLKMPTGVGSVREVVRGGADKISIHISFGDALYRFPQENLQKVN